MIVFGIAFADAVSYFFKASVCGTFNPDSEFSGADQNYFALPLPLLWLSKELPAGWKPLFDLAPNNTV